MVAVTASRALLALGAVLVVFAAGAAVGWHYLAGTPAALRVVQFEVQPPIDASLSPAPVASTAQLAVSADGRQIAYVALKRRGASQIYVRSIDGRESRALPGSEGASFPFWSHDARNIGFFAGGKLKTIAVAGGDADTLCDAPNGRGGTWNVDGVIVFSAMFSSPLFRISATGGQPAAATVMDAHGVGHTWPQFLPDGRHFLYYERSTDPAYRGAYVGELGNPARAVRVLASDSLAIYGSGHLAFVRDGVLFAQAFDERAFRVSGEPIRIADGVGSFRGITGYGAIAASPGGLLAYGPSIGTTTSLQWLTRDGAPTGSLGKPGDYSTPRLSFDQRTVAVSIAGRPNGARDIWTLDVVRNTESRVTSDPDTDWFPAWAPDGERIYFSSTRLGMSTIFQKAGVGREEVLDKEKLLVVSYPDDVSSDGRLLAATQAAENGYDLYVTTLRSPMRKTAFLATKFNEVQSRFAPNTRFIAYASDETGSFEIYVRPFPTGNTQWKVSLAGGMQPEWRRDGRELFYLAADGKMMAVPVSIDGEFQPGVPHALFDVEVPEATAPYQNHYAVTADGQRFLVNTVVDQPTRPALTVMVNWTAALKK